MEWVNILSAPTAVKIFEPFFFGRKTGSLKGQKVDHWGWSTFHSLKLVFLLISKVNVKIGVCQDILDEIPYDIVFCEIPWYLRDFWGP